MKSLTLVAVNSPQTASGQNAFKKCIVYVLDAYLTGKLFYYYLVR